MTEPLEPRRLLTVMMPVDLHTAPVSTILPTELVELNGMAYFAHSDGLRGKGLWKTDGTAAGTVMVKDIYPGTKGSNPTGLTNVNDTLYFAASNTDSNRDLLWRSDGTEAGTVLVADIRPDGDASAPWGITPVGDAIYFFANGTAMTSGQGLWTTDGTAAGTREVKRVSNGGPTDPVALGDALYFLVNINTFSSALWRSDGTAGGTGPIATFNSPVSDLTSVNGTLYFAVNYGRLWASDGTPAGTRHVTDIGNGSTAAIVDNLKAVGNRLFFTARSGNSGIELWTSDGVTAWQVKDIAPGFTSSSPQNLVAMGGKLYFIANNTALGTELWTSDGTLDGTTLVKRQPGWISAPPPKLSVIGDALYFGAGGGPPGAGGLWRSDGTPDGTTFVRRLSAEYSPGPFVGAAGKVIFPAAENSGIEMWVTDGSEAGTRMIRDVYKATGPAVSKFLGVLNGRLYYSASNNSGIGVEPFSTDGTAAGTRLLRDIYPGTGPSVSATGPAAGGFLFFTANDGAGPSPYQLWRTDGTTAGTIKLLTLTNLVTSWGVLGEKVYFTVHQNPGLWMSDGTPVGTIRISDVAVGPIGPAIDGILYFPGSDSARGTELWRSDGTPEGTRLAAELRDGSQGSDPKGLTAVGHTLYFFATDSDGSSRLFKYTPAGGASVVTQRPLWSNAGVGSGGKFFFRAAESPSSGDVELWVSDGTEAGTRRVADVVPGASGSWPEQLIDLDGVVVFGVTEPGGRRLLYRSDGTASGTYPLGDVAPASSTSSSISGFVRVGSVVYLAGTRNGIPGVWQTDGTPAGTLLAASVNPIPNETNQFAQLASDGASLYFAGDDSIHGWEVWRIVADQPPLAVQEAKYVPSGRSADALTFRLNRPAVEGPWPGGVSVTNLTTDAPIPPEKLAWSSDAAGNFVLRFPGYPGGLPDGNYRAVLTAGATGDASGNPLAADFAFDFFALAGDADGDRSVNFGDLVAVAQNYGGTGKTYAQGDFTGDGQVNFADLVILAQRYNTTLPPPPPALAASVTTLPAGDERAKPVFSTAPLTKPARPIRAPAARPRRR